MKNYMSEGLGSYRNRKTRPPLKSFKEFCEEFDISSINLVRLMSKSENAPKPKINHAKSTVQNSWYCIKEMRSWWAKQNKD